jgi:pimeloyl-ACP methyl ester carboxylesterase
MRIAQPWRPPGWQTAYRAVEHMTHDSPHARSVSFVRIRPAARHVLSFGALVLWSASGWSQAAAPTPTASTARGSGSWEVPCPFDSSKALLPVTCGRLKVPENPENPGRVIEIAFMWVKAPQSLDQNGPVVFLNGGPGDNSLYYAEQLVTHAHIRDVVVDRNWIFFDQRGTGRSSPALYCPPEAEWVKQVKTCRDKLIAQGIDLSQYNSARIASDMEALRRALGVRQWNLWGISSASRQASSCAISARSNAVTSGHGRRAQC